MITRMSSNKSIILGYKGSIKINIFNKPKAMISQYNMKIFTLLTLELLIEMEKNSLLLNISQ